MVQHRSQAADVAAGQVTALTVDHDTADGRGAAAQLLGSRTDPWVQVQEGRVEPFGQRAQQDIAGCLPWLGPAGGWVLPVIVQADQDSKTDLLIRIIDEAQLAEATKISVATKK